MITRSLLKEEIDKVKDDYLEILYKLIRALETPLNSEKFFIPKETEILNWNVFIESTYSCMADDPIYRDEQDQYEIREDIK